MQVKKTGEQKQMSDAQLEEVARLFEILSESSRLQLLRALMEGPLTVTELVDATGLKQGNVSKHLSVLRDARFVDREREGNFSRYRLIDPKVHQLCQLMCQRIADDLEQRIQELREEQK